MISQDWVETTAENLSEMSTTVADMVSYTAGMSLATKIAVMNRALRLSAACMRLELDQWKNLLDASEEHDALRNGSALVSEFTDEMREELRNLAQIVLVTQTDFNHWYHRLARHWVNLVTCEPPNTLH